MKSRNGDNMGVNQVCPRCYVGFSTHKSLSEHRLAEKCLQKRSRKKRSDAGQKRGVKDGPERASGSGAKGGSDPVGGEGGADGSKNKGQKRPRKKRSDAGKKCGAKGGPEGASGSGAKAGSDPAAGGHLGADGSKNKVLGSDSDSD